ncbi:unnamed protein product [Oncorhynchus mykiss]|uniref:Uncharacterized protein n=1 Tax=Oncorhynchus mykiss TaxID=8022 RepID=A0A060X2H4_ONCMY|nr:unnamed protein product [Oncorhynchus mykiss]
MEAGSEEPVQSKVTNDVAAQPPASTPEASDLDFWLSNAPVPSDPQEAAAVTDDPPASTPDAGSGVAAVVPDSEPEETVSHSTLLMMSESRDRNLSCY